MTVPWADIPTTIAAATCSACCGKAAAGPWCMLGPEVLAAL